VSRRAVLTIGHSTHPIAEFIPMLEAHGVDMLVDIRTVPRSRHNPQFNRDALPASLAGAEIRYAAMPGLGGLRHPRPDSPNTAWRNASFRGYADYMQTAEFRENLDKLIELSRETQTAIMCAEALPWRCHRSLVADALVVRGIPVNHIMTANSAPAHKLTGFARVSGTRIVYDGKVTSRPPKPARFTLTHRAPA
jgi:uncharacterized protein (DUF488 family)